MQKSIVTSVLFSALFGLAASLVQAEMGPGKKGPHEFSVDEKIERMTKDLNLTSDQKATIKTILEERKTKMESLKNQMEALHEETHSKIAATLTADQKAKFEAKKKERMEKMEDRREERQERKKDKK